MLLTKDCDYSLRIIRALGDMQSKTVQTICDLEHIPHMHAYKALQKLQNAGFVENKQEPDSGYILVKPLGALTLYDIVTVVDDKLALAECLLSDAHCSRNTEDNPCSVHCELARLQETLMNEMKTKRLDKIISYEIKEPIEEIITYDPIEEIEEETSE